MRLPGRGAWVVGLAATGVVLAVVARQGLADWRGLPRDAFHFDPTFLIGSWLVQTAGWLLSVAVWRRIVSAVGGQEVAYRRHLVAHTWSGLGNIVPGSIWLPASRVALYRRYGVPAFAVSAAMVMEWLLVGLAGFALYAFTVPLATSATRLGAASLIIAAGAAASVLHPLVFRAGMRFAARRFPGADTGSPTRPAPSAAQSAAGIVGEAVVLTLAGVGFYFLMRAVAPASSLPHALNAWALSVAVANLLAWMPATVLFKDGAMAVALLPLYGSIAVAVGVVVAWRLWMTAVLLSWALLASAVARVTGVPPTLETAAAQPKE